MVLIEVRFGEEIRTEIHWISRVPCIGEMIYIHEGIQFMQYTVGNVTHCTMPHSYDHYGNVSKNMCHAVVTLK